MSVSWSLVPQSLLPQSLLRQSLLRHEVTKRFDNQPVRFFGADGQAQRVRQMIVLQGAQNKAAFGQEGIGLVGSLAFGLREMDQDEVGDAWRHLEAELADLLGQPRQPLRIVIARPLEMGGVYK